MSDNTQAEAQVTTSIAAPIRTHIPDVTVDSASKAPAVPAAVLPSAQNSATASPATTGGTVQDSASKAVQLGDQDDIPADAELLQLSKKALGSRLERHTRKELKERFGTDNPDDIKAKLDRLAEFEAKQEEQRLAQMSELDRVRESETKALQKAQEWEDRYRQTVTAQVVRTEQNRIERITSQLLDPDFLEVELQKFARHLRKTYSKEELNALPDSEIEQYFKNRVAEKPKMAKDYRPEPVVTTAPLTNGPRAENRPAPPPGVQPEKSFSPNSSNPMSRSEARAEARRQGYDY